jgi:hypothetical protein
MGDNDRPPSEPVGEGHAPVVAVLLAAAKSTILATIDRWR